MIKYKNHRADRSYAPPEQTLLYQDDRILVGILNFRYFFNFHNSQLPVMTHICAHIGVHYFRPLSDHSPMCGQWTQLCVPTPIHPG
ncbi:MAG: hypothetical protein NTV01_20425, partial [Bacteroidia bacterium]|nr:hypothetical protein [Bacteroidia bacterium]